MKNSLTWKKLLKEEISDIEVSDSIGLLVVPSSPCIYVTYQAPAAQVTTYATSESQMNLTEAQKELLCWHNCFGHIGFDRVKAILATGHLAQTESTACRHRLASKAPTPLCAACIYAKQHHTPQPGHTSIVNRDREAHHFICSQKGCLFHTRGKDLLVAASLLTKHQASYILNSNQFLLRMLSFKERWPLKTFTERLE